MSERDFSVWQTDFVKLRFEGADDFAFNQDGCFVHEGMLISAGPGGKSDCRMLGADGWQNLRSRRKGWAIVGKSDNFGAVSDLTLGEGGLKVSAAFSVSESRHTSDSMKIAFPLTAVVLTSWIVSCTTTPDEAPPTPPSDVAENRGAPSDVPPTDGSLMPDGTNAQDDEMRREEEGGQQPIPENVEDPKPSAPATKAAVPVARRVPGRDGFVFSPYNNKMINVKDFASGTMVADPTYPPAEKKYFRVP